jgi:hypothetical protein
VPAWLVSASLFKALILLFPNVAERVADRHGGEYTVKNFNGVLDPMFRRVKKAELQHPGTSHLSLYDSFRKSLSAGFSLGKTGA